MIDPKRTAFALAIAVVGAVGAGGRGVAVADTKEACVDAHSRGQDERQAGHLSSARKLFLACAQASCPAVVQAECAQFVDDLNRTQPTITFVARDADGHDLADTTVDVDGVTIATRLDDGRAYDVDPGKHVIRFRHDGRDHELPIVVNTGEKGRTVIGTFPSVAAPGGPTGATPLAPARSSARPGRIHPTGATILAIGGAVVFAAGAGILAWGLTSIPDNCELSSNTCVAPPGDPVFDDASSAVTKVNIGFIAGGIGAAAAIGGLIWYFGGARAAESASPPGVSAAPWLTPGGGGIGVTSRF